MQDFDPFRRGICLFCGNKVEEHFYSGSYETYEDCSCEQLKLYRAARMKVQELQQVAEERLEAFELQDKIQQAEQQLEQLKARQVSAAQRVIDYCTRYSPKDI